MGESMATQIEQPFVPAFEKVLLQNSFIAEKFLSVFKQVITNNLASLPEVTKLDVQKATKDYVETSLHELSIELPNINDLSKFFVKHIDSIQPIIAICRDVKSNFADSEKLSLVYELEKEESSEFESVTLYVTTNKRTVELERKLVALVEPYLMYLIASNVVFTAELNIN